MNGKLSQFNYVASHDLQKPLQTFISRIAETEETALIEKGKMFFSRIQASAARMQKLTNDLLAYVRTKATQDQFEMTDLNTILNTVLQDLRVMIEEKQSVVLYDVLPSLKAIPFQLEQLFTNLLSDSLKFTLAWVLPKIKIRYQLEIKVQEGQYRRKHAIRVEDNGIGFEPEYAQRIFQVFQRLHTRSVYEGTGIGLAIVKKIVENHGGTITTTSTPEAGAAFEIRFPVE